MIVTSTDSLFDQLVVLYEIILHLVGQSGMMEINKYIMPVF